jgi:tRNA threonylcarbamoyladenosine biosynthesis protein TsaB
VIILSLDTTTRAGSAAVVRDGIVLAEIVGDPSLKHGQRLPADLMRVLEMAKVALPAVTLFAVAAGPGSFTGMRVGIATVQGLAMAAGARVVAVSTLDALARAGTDGRRLVGAWMDAQRSEVYAALYGPDGREVRCAAMSGTPVAVLDAWSAALAAGPVRIIGDGALRYQDVVDRSLGARAEVVPPPPLAGIIGQMAAEAPERAVVPHAVMPIYVRKSDAELTRDRRAVP